MKVLTHIVFGMALVWFGGAGLAFSSYPPPMPTCPCQHSPGESGCCCDGKAPQKTAPACSVNPAPVAACTCNYDRSDSSSINIIVNRTVDPITTTHSAIIMSDQESNLVLQTFPALPSSIKPITPLRI